MYPDIRPPWSTLLINIMILQTTGFRLRVEVDHSRTFGRGFRARHSIDKRESGRKILTISGPGCRALTTTLWSTYSNGCS